LPEVRRALGRPALAAGLLLALWVDGAGASALVKWGGGKTPALKLAEADGRQRSISEWRGKTVIVNFWATWCEPCRDEMPSLERLKSRMAGKPFDILAVNVGESPERVARFTQEVPVTFPIVYDRDSSVARSWKVRGYPTSYVLGPDGRIRYYFVGELDWSHDEIVRVIESIR
jgi:thiol-disulfide isomerase/thioredoxin